MGFFTAVLGPGSISIAFDKAEYYGGDVLSGQITLRVTSRIDRSQPMQMEIVGEETMRWRKKPVDHHKHRHSDTCSSREHGKWDDEDHRERREVYQVLREEICLDIPGRSYEVGEHVFPFDYRLPATLPGSFSFKHGVIRDMRDVKVRCEYSLRVRLPVDSMWQADIVKTEVVYVREQPSKQVPRSITQSEARQVNFLHLFNQGECHLTASIERDVLPMGGCVQLDCTVENQSSWCIRSIEQRLNQIVELHRYETSRSLLHQGPPTVTRTMSERSSDGFGARQRKEILLAQHIEYTPTWWSASNESQLLPSMRSHFLSVRYELVVQCCQTLCSSASVIIPVVITTKLP
ncbi:hypothetical protein Poli38472_010180 [Pythium oligandrum]|uniref:Arrestin C-terminal-like domain-containing protein n=1 Tax=Pythium oligandrum TaxID=41045 RepID=A0A8K1FDQ4_PYTOL|nr:hypothetical protein Poli38472_010180 [Pythium oligandrum]|eukprot:TMW58621.1 hypothetical protein Poli38472_010180 [Pythium oligandrum]